MNQPPPRRREWFSPGLLPSECETVLTLIQSKGEHLNLLSAHGIHQTEQSSCYTYIYILIYIININMMHFTGE